MNSPINPTDFAHRVEVAMSVPTAPDDFISELRHQLLKEARSGSAQKPVFRVNLTWAAPATIALILLITTLVIGPSKIWAAVQELFGYVPGVGFVQGDEAPLVLPEAIETEREGITLVIEQVVADSERTILIYKVSGLSVQAANSQGESALTGSTESLQLEDSSTLTPISGQLTGWGSGYRSQLIFPPLPREEDTARFIVPRLQTMPAGVSPENWETPFTLVPATGEITILPVEVLADELETPGPEDSTSDETIIEDKGISLDLARIVEMEDGFLFEGTIKWTGPENSWIDFASGIELTDANGERIPSEEVAPDPSFSPHSGTEVGWAIRSFSKSQPGPWTFSLSQVGITHLPGIDFYIDLGNTPQIGQIWQLNQSFEFQDFDLTLTAIEVEEGSRQSNYRLAFTFTPSEGLYSIALEEQDSNDLTGGGGSGSGESGLRPFLDYETVPAGVHQITIAMIGASLKGDWQLTWQPPEAAGASGEVYQQPEACIESAGWESPDSAQAAGLPEGITGDLLLLTHIGEPMPVISLKGLHSDFSQEYGTGAWVSISPDGSTIAIPSDDGIQLADTRSGATSLLTGTSQGNYPLWSPDGDQIAFHRWNDEALYRVRLDGSDPVKIYEGTDVIYPAAWTPSGEIIYMAFGDEGMEIRSIALPGGQPSTLIGIKDRTPLRPAVSPDGLWIIYGDQLERDGGSGIYLSQIDGTEERLLASSYQGSEIAFGLGAWSPDGKWVALNVWDINNAGANPIPLLVSIDDCEAIPLMWMEGEVVGWRN